MALRHRLTLILPGLLAWAAGCSVHGRPTHLPPPPPPPPAAAIEAPRPPPPDILPARLETPAPQQPGMPGAGVAWREAPRLRGVPAGLGPFLSDVESRLPREMGTRYRDDSRITWCHETTHGIHAHLRGQYRVPAFYPGGGRFALVEPPAVTLAEVAAAVPPGLRGTRYETYLVKARRDWGRDPLYVWDEWVAYNNGMAAGIEEGARRRSGASDDAVACLELSGYALAVAAAARRKGVPVAGQFRELLAWELRRSLGLYARAAAMPAFAWGDRRLERAWRDDPFIAAELRALYGDALSVPDLLP